MTVQKKKILFILPELAGPGGMELENLGFITAIQSLPELDVSVLNFYINRKYFRKTSFNPLCLSFFEKMQLAFSIKFLKIYLKSGRRIDRSLANLAFNFPEVLGDFISKAVQDSTLCFAGIRPGSLLNHVHDLAEKYKKPFVYHEISRFSPKHRQFFQKVDSYGTFLISGIEKKEDLELLFPQAKALDIRQWLYDGQDKFLRSPETDPERLVFGMVSRLDFGKNLEVVFEALAILKGRGKKPKFLLFGGGAELQKLKKLAAALAVESLIDFRGAIKLEERSKAYEEVDVFVMSSLVEGGPVAVLEAMASGRPIISTNVGDVRNRVECGINGYILDSPSDPEELADKMCIYLDQKKLVHQHGENSRSKFLREFDEGKGRELFQKAISQLIQN